MTTSTQICTLRCQHENWPPFICSEGKDHFPKTSERRKHIKEWLFSAARHGCRSCVQHCIEVIGLDVHIQSNISKFTVMNWAQWAIGKNVEGAQEVVRYLASEWHMDSNYCGIHTEWPAKTTVERQRKYNDHDDDDDEDSDEANIRRERWGKRRRTNKKSGLLDPDARRGSIEFKDGEEKHMTGQPFKDLGLNIIGSMNNY
jgi:hypothetical protein